MSELLPPLLDRTLAAALVVGVLCGLVGTLVVLRRRAFFTVALTHATFPGGVIAALAGVNISLGAGLFGLLLVGLMALLSRIRRQGQYAPAGIVLSFGYALGAALLAFFPGKGARVDSFLTGSILTVSDETLLVLGAVLALALLVFLLLGKELLFSSFDRRGFQAAGYREGLVDAVVLALISITVAAAMPAIGSILAIAMIAAPAASARLFARTFGGMLLASCALGVTAAVAGLLASRGLDLAAGGAIALAASLVFLLTLAVRGLAVRRRRRERVGYGVG